MITLIAAIGLNNELGYDGKLVWVNKEDQQRFRRLTLGKTVVMGRKTFESIGKILPDRENIVLSNTQKIEGVIVTTFQELDLTKDLMVIGGEEIYKLFIDIADTLEITQINKNFKADTFFPNFGDEWELTTENKRDSFSFKTFKKIEY